MKTVDQEFVGDGVIGDCLRACTASVLDLPLKDVPHFLRDYPGAPPKGMPYFYDAWTKFMEDHGVIPSPIWGPFEKTPKLLGYYLAAGPASREYGVGQHIVIMRDGELFHDPHPSRAGVTEVQAVWLLKEKR